MGHILLGHILAGYKSMLDSFSSVMYMALGEFDYDSIVEASSPIAAFVYFYSFVFIVSIVVLNMVIAIIFTAYDSLTATVRLCG